MSDKDTSFPATCTALSRDLRETADTLDKHFHNVRIARVTSSSVAAVCTGCTSVTSDVDDDDVWHVEDLLSQSCFGSEQY